MIIKGLTWVVLGVIAAVLSTMLVVVMKAGGVF